MSVAATPQEGLLVRAGMYQLLAAAYTYPSPDQSRQMARAAEILLPWIGLLDPAAPDRVRELLRGRQSTDPAELEGAFNRLFSGAMACAPLETAYEPDVFRKQHTLADIAGFYRAFGFDLPEGSRWSPDSIGVELEFCSILLQRMSHAISQGWGDQAAICADALKKFLADHLGRWAESFATDLASAAAHPLYEHLAVMTGTWLALELPALGIEPDRLRSRKVFADDTEFPMCGGCTACGPAGPGPAGPRPNTPCPSH